MQLIEKTTNNVKARLLVREYLQARLLHSLQDSGVFNNWAFVGGTALRFLYLLPRFSEDLDFSLKMPGQNTNFIRIMKNIQKMFSRENYSVSLKINADKTVQSCFIKFNELLYELDLSSYQNENISIKVEIDTNPPGGAMFSTTVIRHHALLNILHYDKSSLFAGKLYALFTRKYAKGRDVYDLAWYLSNRNWPEPNISFLNNALKQTGWRGPAITLDSWKTEIASVISKYDWEKIMNDVSPFLEDKGEIQLINKEVILNLLKSKG